MIEVIEGRGVGAGKSYMVLVRLLTHWARGGTACVSDTVVIHWDAVKALLAKRAGVVLEDDQYRTISSADLERLHEVTPPGSDDLPVLIVVDEAQSAFNARDWADKAKRPFFDWLCQSRHDDNDVIILSQSQANVDKQIRRLCTYIWVTRNAENFPLFGMPLARLIRSFTFGMNDGKYFRWTQLDQDGRTKLDAKWHHFDLAVGRCYKSKAMALAHKRAGAAIAARKLQRVKKETPRMIKILVPVVVLALIAGAWQLTRNPAKEVVAKHAPAAAGSPATPAGSPPAIVQAYELTAEKWLYRDARTIRTDSGTYTVGRMSKRGLVEMIDDGVIRIKQPDGKLAYIVTEDVVTPSAYVTPPPTPPREIIVAPHPQREPLTMGSSLATK